MSSSSQGTLEVLAKILAEILHPLKEKLAEGESQVLFAELGLVLPPSLQAKPSLKTNMDLVAGSAGELPGLIETLAQAIESDNISDIVSKGADIISKSVDIFTGIKDLANAFKNVQAGDVGGNSAYANKVKNFGQDFFENLLHFLIVGNIERIAGLAEGLELAGVVERAEKLAEATDPADQVEYIERKLHLNKLFSFFKNPSEQFKDLYDWGESTFGNDVDGPKDLIKKLGKILNRAGVPAVYDTSSDPPVLDALAVEMYVDKSVNPRGISVGLGDSFVLEPNYQITQDEWELDFQMAFNIPVNAKLTVQPNGKVTITPPGPGALNGKAAVSWLGKKSDGEAMVLIGQAGGSRLDVQEFGVNAGSEFSWSSGKTTADFLVEAFVKQLHLVIDFGSADSFIQSNVSKDGFEAAFDLKIGYSTEAGVYFVGSGAMEIFLPTHISLGPVELLNLIIAVKIAEKLRLELGTTLKFQLGPFTAAVENLGLKADFDFPDGGGNLGPLDLDIGFKPPNGIGLAIDASVIKGGGYLYMDHDKGEYAGVAELVIQELVAVKAIGIITTKMPDGSKGFSFLLIITAEFTPIQLGFGFTLNGVGGLIAINRGMNLEPIAEGVRTNAISSIMFPDDPVGNAPQIIANLNSFFPIAQDRYTFGLMAYIGWGTPTLVHIQFGLMIQVPDPIILAILGIIKMVLPDEKAPILKLQVNFIGAIDFGEKYMFFFASLFDSKILTFTLSGDMYFLISWGDNPNFVFSVGGFHPDYSPPPLKNVDKLNRLTLSLLADNPRLTLSTYFAVTSNTVQFGASIDFYFKIWKVKVIGYLYFDALFQFNPFYFKISIGAGLSVMWGSTELFGIHLSGSLEGPTPWRVKGKAKFKILFVSVKVKIDKTFGEKKETTLPPVEVLPRLVEAVEATNNWKAHLPAAGSLLVSTRTLETEELIAHPYGVLSVSQSKVPLKLQIDKVGNDRPTDYKKFALELADFTDPGKVEDFFAPAQYIKMNNDQKISRKSFEKFDSGVKALGADGFSSDDYVEKIARYEAARIDTEYADDALYFFGVENAAYFATWVGGNAVARSARAKEMRIKQEKKNQRVKIDQEKYVIVKSADMQAVTNGGELLEFSSQTAANVMLDVLKNEIPELEGQVQVVPAYELNES